VREVHDPYKERAHHGTENLCGNVDRELVSVACDDGGGDRDGRVEVRVRATPRRRGEDTREDSDAPPRRNG